MHRSDNDLLVIPGAAAGKSRPRNPCLPSAILSLGLSAACTFDAVPPDGSGSETKPAVSAALALDTFDAICGAALPDFTTSVTALARAGFSGPDGSTSYLSPDHDLNFRIVEGPGPGASCSMTFSTRDGAAEVTRTFSDIGQFGPTDLGTAALYRGTAALVFLNAPIERDGRTHVNIRMFSER